MLWDFLFGSIFGCGILFIITASLFGVLRAGYRKWLRTINQSPILSAFEGKCTRKGGPSEDQEAPSRPEEIAAFPPAVRRQGPRDGVGMAATDVISSIS